MTHRMIVVTGAYVILALGAPSVPTFSQAPPAGSVAPRIIVDPEYLASRDGDNAHVELHVAANPRRPRNLIGGAITHTRPAGTPGTKVYATFDGGQSWIDYAFPEQVEYGGGDPQVAFTPAGTGIFATLTLMPDDIGRTGAVLHVYRSEDGGRTWSKPANLGASYDHEMIAVDQTTGRFAGRIYLSALYGRESSLGLFRSDDDGRSFIGPVKFFEGKTSGAYGLPMAVFSDGTLLLTFSHVGSGFFTVLSEDGGVTFSKPRPAPNVVSPPRSSNDLRLSGDAAIAIDTSPRFRDRVYRVWNAARSGPLRIHISFSNDRGMSWSEPKPIDAAPPEGSQQFLPAIAVNKDGVLGVSWNDTRDARGEHAFRRYFSASIDGGATFLPPVAVSTELSRPFGAGNLAITPTPMTAPADIDKGAVRLLLLSSAGRWGNGGDYGGMAADADGAFHPFWADSRTGTYQAWSARVRVSEAGAQGSQDGAARAGAPSGDPVDITSDLEFVADPTRYDPATKELALRIRLRNKSDRPLYGPLTLTIRKFGSGMGDEGREHMPDVLNATNGKANDGATFVYDEALGSERRLPPGGLSGPVLITLRVRDPLRIPDMHLVVSGKR